VFLCVQTVQDKLSVCGEMLSKGESVTSGGSELSRLRRRHRNLSKKTRKQCERVSRAAQLRDCYWTRRSSLETCLEDCQRRVTSVDSDDVDTSDKVAQLEASYCCLFTFLLPNIIVL